MLTGRMVCRHLEKQAAEEKERERQERRRKERKHRDAFMELLQRHLSEGVIVARMRWKVLPSPSVDLTEHMQDQARHQFAVPR